MRTALQLLEQIQSQFADFIPSEELKNSATKKIIGQMKQSLGIDLDFFQLKNYFNDISDIPTKYQSPSNYALLRILVKKIEKVTQEHSDTLKKLYKINLVKFPIYGSIPMGDFSAQVVGCGTESEILMLFCEGLFGMANLVCKAVAQCFPETNTDDNQSSFSINIDNVKDLIKKDKTAMARFTDIILAYSFKHNPYCAKQYIIDRERFRLVELLRNAFEIFVVAHEYAHLCLGHISKESTKRKTDISNDYDRVIYSWAEELSADLLAAQITVLSADDPALGMAGIWICFDVMDTLDTLYINDNDERSILQQYSTHPPAQIRKDNIKNAIENKDCFPLLETIDFIFSEFNQFSNRMLQILKTLADKYGLEVNNIDLPLIQEIIYKSVNQSK